MPIDMSQALCTLLLCLSVPLSSAILRAQYSAMNQKPARITNEKPSRIRSQRPCCQNGGHMCIFILPDQSIQATRGPVIPRPCRQSICAGLDKMSVPSERSQLCYVRMKGLAHVDRC